jgi:hypothetical protein
MTTTTIHNGRLCNQIIRNLAVSAIAEKHDLQVNYANQTLIQKLGIFLFNGRNVYPNYIELNDDNYFSIYNSGQLTSNLLPNKSYFQTREITNFLYERLHTDEYKLPIIENNPFNYRYKLNNDIHIHVRLGDVSHFTPGLQYFVNTINKIRSEKMTERDESEPVGGITCEDTNSQVTDKIYISTDEPTHPIIRTLIDMYPETILLTYNEIHTIQYASTCKHIILSHGSFSAIIGYLSFFLPYIIPNMNQIKFGMETCFR